jgi:chloramphenicol-sensitive protein RarD
VIMTINKEFSAFITLIKQPKLWLKVLAPAVFISINWLVYIWSVNSGYVIEASLGYYINPLVLTLFGFIFFKERLSRLQVLGLSLAALGVLYKTVTYGQFPFIALILAVSFAIYGLLKKWSNLSSVKGLSFETLIVGIPALIFLMNQEASGVGISGRLPIGFWLLIAFSGIATATPLILYAESTKRLPLNVVGFLQYISPTLSLLLGIFVFKEKFDSNALFAFIIIWAGLILFYIDQYIKLKGMRDSI